MLDGLSEASKTARIDSSRTEAIVLFIFKLTN
jgi:hypothetical protein